MKLENDFTVPASPAEAWELLNDVPEIVPCMPGAELKEVVGENRWKALMHVKLGPISLQFDTDIERQEADEAERRVVLSAKARELRGRGGAQAKIESSLADAAEGTAVKISTDLNLQGTVAQYGRGIVADVSSQLTDQFAACLASKLAGPEAAAAEAAPGAGAGAAGVGQPRAATPAHPVKPVGGLRIGLRAVWRQIVGLFRRLVGLFRRRRD
jgi:carbon monoxide dehydrogenase subunit G